MRDNLTTSSCITSSKVFLSLGLRFFLRRCRISDLMAISPMANVHCQKKNRDWEKLPKTWSSSRVVRLPRMLVNSVPYIKQTRNKCKIQTWNYRLRCGCCWRSSMWFYNSVDWCGSVAWTGFVTGFRKCLLTFKYVLIASTLTVDRCGSYCMLS